MKSKESMACFDSWAQYIQNLSPFVSSNDPIHVCGDVNVS